MKRHLLTPLAIKSTSWAVLALLFCAGSAVAQPKQNDSKTKAGSFEKKLTLDEEPDFWVKSRNTKEAAAVQVIAARDPFVTAVLLKRGKDYVVWGMNFEPAPAPAIAPKLTPELVGLIADDRSWPDIRKKPPHLVTKRERAEIQLYAEALVKAFRTPPEYFANSAKDLPPVTWGDLFLEPEKFRGNVVPIKGKLVRLRRRDSPRAARDQEFALRDMYEGWVFMETFGSNPISVVFARIPDGFKLGEKIDHKIRFNGYYIKRYRYKAKDQWRRTPFFIAPNFVKTDAKAKPPPATAADDEALGGTILAAGIAVVVIVIATVVLLGGLNWWYRKDDARFHKNLEEIRAKSASLEDQNGDGSELLYSKEALSESLAENAGNRMGFDESASDRISFTEDSDQNEEELPGK